MSIEVEEKILSEIPEGQILKIKLEVDTDPPSGFSTQTRYLLTPIPFAVRAYILPDLFAWKMHAVLYRGWESRIKGRDWYDFVWFVAYHPELNLSHLEQRMRQTGHWSSDKSLSPQVFLRLLKERIDGLDVKIARREVESYVKEPEMLNLWTKEFFIDVATRIVLI